MRASRLGALALLVFLVAVAPGDAGAIGRASSVHATGKSVIRVSGPSPYADCHVPLLDGERVYVNAEVEPWITVDPSDPKHLVGVWQQDRTTFGGGKGLVAASSFDRGHTWHRTTLPFSACDPGGLDSERASDPWVSIGPDGTVYTSSLSVDAVGNGVRAVAAATSTDGGVSWNEPVVIHGTRSRSGIFDDKESITADPVRPGVAYATWTALTFRAAFTGPVLFARTTDGGATWEKPRTIYHARSGEGTVASQIVIDPRTGTLFDLFDVFRPNRRWISVAISHDAGTTWSDPVRVSRDFSKGVRHPNGNKPLRVGDQVPDIAVDPTNGDLYVVWEDSRFSDFRYDEVALSRSTDVGRTWSRPIRVNTPTGLPAFTPSVEVNPHGVIGVSYYDLREVGSAKATLPTDAWLIKLRDGGRRRVGEWKLAGPFDSLTAPFAGSGYFLGDYEGLTVTGGRFAAMFAAANDGKTRNRTDIVFKVR